MEPPGPAFGRPDDKLRVIREQLRLKVKALNPGYGPQERPSIRATGFRGHDFKNGVNCQSRSTIAMRFLAGRSLKPYLLPADQAEAKR